MWICNRIELTHWSWDKIDAILKCIFSNENYYILMQISLKYMLRGQIINMPALVQMMAWCWTTDTVKLTCPRTFADKRWLGLIKRLFIIMLNITKSRPKSLLGPVKAQKFVLCLEQVTSHYLNQRWPSLLTHICITWPEWIKQIWRCPIVFRIFNFSRSNYLCCGGSVYVFKSAIIFHYVVNSVKLQYFCLKLVQYNQYLVNTVNTDGSMH